ncbi:hypothetical protein QR680_012107 [Steinernema hermaphroditum]|uniref:Protein kinase domain-containing protein n=1 Tax=Steinernema hermaphroditum TaxID=289476 RepID=A0AA39LZA5_9BILA|nr:hypothetical protein QR680_012107 [Steinernema hermaphroditum]
MHFNMTQMDVCLLEIKLSSECSPGPLTGSTITGQSGEIRLHSELGKGAFASVYKGITQGSCCAVKVVTTETEKDMERFQREVDVLSRLMEGSHKNVVQILGYDYPINYGGLALLFFELVPNGTLYDHVQRSLKLHFSEAWMFYEQIICGLAYLHSLGIYHRDIKSDNLLMETTLQVKITDFGLSYVDEGSCLDGLPLFDDHKGSAPYLPPEFHKEGSFRADKGDLWAAAVTLAFMCTAYEPWKDTTEEDPYFLSFKQGMYDEYWESMGDGMPIVAELLHPEADRRLTSEWYLKCLEMYSG